MAESRAMSLAARLRELTVPGALAARDGGLLRCTACAHRCVLGPGRTGSCGVRFEEGGEVRVPFGYVARKYVRPVETNTIFHVLPGALALTFGMFGCDLRCTYCHNWKVSQALREGIEDEPRPTTPAALVDEALAAGARVICAAYNEPMIAAEWVRAVFEEAKRRGLVTAIVSDGNTTSEALAHVRPVTDVFRVDLKGSTSDQYKQLGGRLEPVMAAIAEARSIGLWVEVVTLVVPGLNDDEPGLGRLARDLAAIDAGIPWHLNAFVPRYKLLNRPPTAIPLLVSVAGTAYARGLKHVYVGNVAREFPHLGHTRCPGCAEEVITRLDYRTMDSRLVGVAADQCPSCATRIEGIFRSAEEGDGSRSAERPPRPAQGAVRLRTPAR